MMDRMISVPMVAMMGPIAFSTNDEKRKRRGNRRHRPERENIRHNEAPGNIIRRQHEQCLAHDQQLPGAEERDAQADAQNGQETHKQSV